MRTCSADAFRAVRLSGASALLALTVQLPASAAPAPAATAASVAEGKELYEGKCGGCHSVDANRIGPLHRGVVGRKVASVKDFNYSPALKTLGGVWTPQRLDAWLTSPQAVAPGTSMYFMLEDASQRAAIIAYLKSVSP